MGAVLYDVHDVIFTELRHATSIIITNVAQVELFLNTARLKLANMPLKKNVDKASWDDVKTHDRDMKCRNKVGLKDGRFRARGCCLPFQRRRDITSPKVVRVLVTGAS